MTTQTETIEWHIGLEKNPKKNTAYLLHGKANGVDVVMIGEYKTDGWLVFGQHVQLTNIIAWAELPKGWK